MCGPIIPWITGLSAAATTVSALKGAPSMPSLQPAPTPVAPPPVPTSVGTDAATGAPTAAAARAAARRAAAAQSSWAATAQTGAMGLVGPAPVKKTSLLGGIAVPLGQGA